MAAALHPTRKLKRYPWLASLGTASMLSFIAVVSLGFRLGTDPPPPEALRYVEGRVERCSPEKEKGRNPPPKRVQVRLKDIPAAFVNTPDLLYPILAACERINASPDGLVRIVYNPGVLASWPPSPESSSVRQPSTFHFIWEVSLNGRALHGADYGNLSRVQYHANRAAERRVAFAAPLFALFILLLPIACALADGGLYVKPEESEAERFARELARGERGKKL